MKIIRYIKKIARITHFFRGYSAALKDAKESGIWICPSCHEWMANPPRDYNICPHCDMEFGYDAPESDDGLLFDPRLGIVASKETNDTICPNPDCVHFAHPIPRLCKCRCHGV
jgi:rubrerythrin